MMNVSFTRTMPRNGGCLVQKHLNSVYPRAFLSSSTTAEIERKFVFNDKILSYCKENAVNYRAIYMRDVYFDNPTYDLTTRDMWLRQRNDKLELKWPMVRSSSKGGADKHDTLALSGLDFYQESTDKRSIVDTLHELADVTVKFPKTIETIDEKVQALSVAGIEPFGTFLTNRVRYNLSMVLPIHLNNHDRTTGNSINMFIDIDTVKFILPASAEDQYALSENDLNNSTLTTYQIGEIEFDFSGNKSQVTETTISNTDMDSNAAIMQHVFRVMGIEPAPVRGKVLEYLVRFRPQHFEALRKSGQLASKGL